jgi:hypothetical protein
MNRFVAAVLITMGATSAYPPSSPAQLVAAQQPPAPTPRISVCSLLTKEEVKEHLPWIPLLDNMPIDEEPVGVSGSSCNYPSVFVQVLPFTQNFMDMVRKQDGIGTVAAVGDEAYFRHNPNGYAEIAVRTGDYVLTLQASVDGDVEAVKPGVLNLANAYVTKLH